MIKIAAWFMVAVGLIYSDLDSRSFLHGVVLPLLLTLSLMYLFWLKGFIALVAAVGSFHYMDIGSTSNFEGVVLPLFFAACVMYLIWWLGGHLGPGDTGAGGGFSGDSGGGDTGGGDGGG